MALNLYVEYLDNESESVTEGCSSPVGILDPFVKILSQRPRFLAFNLENNDWRILDYLKLAVVAGPILSVRSDQYK
jgi:hypothetical protein